VRNESEKETVHRLEAFSDIVIGFSLAQLGATLIFNKENTLDLGGLLTFFASFAIVCSLWYFHHRLFQSVFVPKALPIVLNFVWLAVVVLLVFVSVHTSAGGFAQRNPALLYFALYASAYAILTLQTALGVWRYGSGGDAAVKARAVKSVAISSYWTLVFIACALEVRLLSWTAAIGVAFSWTFAVAVAGSVCIGTLLRRRLARAN
jgi:uncharacterized membrane protein